MPERLELPTGRILQTPPMTSAIKVGGERLYRAARRGEEVERPSREVEITRAELVGRDEESATFEIDCSSGTYVRTLVEELGDAFCQGLRRTAIGPHRIEQASPAVRPVGELLPFLPELELSAEEARLVRNGIRLPVPEGREAEAGPTRLASAGELVAVARVVAGELRTEVVLG
jgi:tRNA pseudouridine55 synthase